MRLSNERIKRLQILLKELCDLDYTDEQVQEAGAAIMRFVKAKAQREHELANHKDDDNGKATEQYRTARQGRADGL